MGSNQYNAICFESCIEGIAVENAIANNKMEQNHLSELSVSPPLSTILLGEEKSSAKLGSLLIKEKRRQGKRLEKVTPLSLCKM
jgi:hypothetical protein